MKIAIIEKEESIDLAGFDKVVSFCKNDYLDINTYVSLYDIIEARNPTALSLDTWLESQKSDQCVYRGIDMLQAYRLSIFDFLSNLAKKVLVIRRMIEKDAPSEIWISYSNPARNLRYPFLNSFIRDFVPPETRIKYFAQDTMSERSDVPACAKKIDFLALPFMAARYFLNMGKEHKKDNILIYSDLNKIPTLCDNLKGKNVIFLREELPESLLFYLSSRGVNVKLFSDFKLSQEQKKEVDTGYDQLLANINNLNDTLDIWGLDFTPYVKKYLADVWRNELKHVLEVLEQSRQLLEKYPIRSLLLDEDKAISKNILVQLCKKYDVRSYVNCHGEPYQKVGYWPVIADKLLVWGEKQKEVFLRWGFKANDIIVTGCAKYDKYLKTPVETLRAKICKDLKLEPSKPVALLAPWPLSKRGDDIVESAIWDLNKQIVSSVEAIRDVQIIIKLHPSDESESYFESLIKELHSNKIRVLKNYDPLTLTKGADFLIICISTLAIDGLAYKKPVILTDKYSMDRYKDLGVFYDGTSIEKLTSSIKGITSTAYKDHIKNWQSAVDLMLNGMDGKASMRIAQELSQ